MSAGAMRSRAFAAVLSAVALPGPALAASASWTRSLSGHPEGAAMGDVDGDGLREVAVLLRGGTYTPGQTPVPAPGSVVLLSSTGAVRWQYPVTTEVAGFPIFADVTGDGADEVVFCEMSATGMCRVLNGNGTLRSSYGPYYFPGMASCGPAAADLNGDGRKDLVFTSYGGKVVAINGQSGAQMWSYDVFAQNSDLLFTYPSIADIDNDGDLEVVVGGYERGGLYVLDGKTGALAWQKGSLYDSLGNYFYATGALLADLDGDRQRDVIVAVEGNPAALIAYNHTGALRWRLPLPNAFVMFLSPTAVDIDGDGDLEILVTDGEGTLYVVSHTGSVVTSRSLGGETWLPPSILSYGPSGQARVLSGTSSSLMIMDGPGLVLTDSYADPSGMLTPQPMVSDLDRDGRVDITLAGWNSGVVTSIELTGEKRTSKWLAHGGGSDHIGRLDPAQTWWDFSWTRRRKLRLDNRAQNENLSSFPTLVALNTGNINYGQTQNAGQDIRFVDANGFTELPYEIEQWNEAGTSTVWVQVPRVDAATDQDYIWMYYGNPAAADGQRQTAVWSNGFNAVYHLNNAFGDSTASAFNGTNQGTTGIGGMISQGRDFNGTNAWVNLGANRAFLNSVTSWTQSAWVFIDTYPNAGAGRWLIAVSVNSQNPSVASRATMGLGATGNGGSRVPQAIIGARATDTEAFKYITSSGTPLSTGVWRHMTAVCDYALHRYTLYVDGAFIANYNTPTFAANTTPATLARVSALGAQDDGSAEFFDGRMDEVRISRGTRSAAWIAADYKAMRNLAASPFVLFGPEERP